MSLKLIVELNEKELKEIICKYYGLSADLATIRISQVPADYGQGTNTNVIVEAKETTKPLTLMRSDVDKESPFAYPDDKR